MNYVQLRSYLDTEAATYAALSNAEAATTLNTPSIVRIRSSMSGSEIFGATDATEFAGLAAADRQQWLALCAIDNINPANGTAAVQLTTSLFGGGSTTVTTLASLREETISPAQEQGFGSVKEDDVRIARI